MQQCVAMLVPDPDEKSLRLVSKQPKGDVINLEEHLSDFLNDFNPGVHIAVVCGVEEPWSVNVFAEILQQKRPKYFENQPVIPFDGASPPQKVIVSCICAAVIKKNDGQTGDGLRYFLDNVSKVLELISTLVVAQKVESEDVKAAQEAIEQATEVFDSLAKRVSVRMRNETSMQEIQDALSSNEIKNGCPIIKILAFLPEDAFVEFDEKDYYFFRQIEYVLCFTEFTPEMIKALMDRIRKLEKKVEELSNESQVRELENKIRILEGRLAELQAQIEMQAAEQESHEPVVERTFESRSQGEIRVDLGEGLYIAEDILELLFLVNYLVQERKNEDERLISDIDKSFISRHYKEYTPKDGEEMSAVEKNTDVTVNISTETTAEKETAIENTINRDDQEQYVKRSVGKDTLARAKELWVKQKGDRTKEGDSIERDRL